MRKQFITCVRLKPHSSRWSSPTKRPVLLFLAFSVGLGLGTAVAARQSNEPGHGVIEAEKQAVTSTQMANPQTSSPMMLKDKYHSLEVGEFGVSEDVDLPEEYSKALPDETVKEFRHWDRLKNVLVSGQNPADPTEPVLRLSGTVISYDKGSRAERYLGFGGGAGEIVVDVAFRDRSTGETVVTERIIGTQTGGLFGGGAKGIIHEFARTCVTITKLLMEKPVPAASEQAPFELLSAVKSSADRKLVTILGQNTDQGQAELNTQAAAEYRVVAFTPKGANSAVITMELSATPSEVYQYQLMHVHEPPNLQKDINAAATEGYRYFPRSLAWLKSDYGGVVVAIVEKPPTVSNVRYTYRVHSPMRVSNAQKDIVNEQRMNFSLVGTLERPNIHIVLMEKANGKDGE